MERKWTAPVHRPKLLVQLFSGIIVAGLIVSSYFYYTSPTVYLLFAIFFLTSSLVYFLMKLRFFSTYDANVIVVNPQTLIIDEIDNWTSQINPQPHIIPLANIRLLDYSTYKRKVRGIIQEKMFLRAKIGKRDITFGANFADTELKEIALTLSGSTYISPDLQHLLGITQAQKTSIDVDDIVNFAVDKFKDYLKKR